MRLKQQPVFQLNIPIFKDFGIQTEDDDDTTLNDQLLVAPAETLSIPGYSDET